MGDFPFEEQVICEWDELGSDVREVIRTFSDKVDPSDLIWHRDREFRNITVLDSNGWQFQLEDQLPVKLKQGDFLQIPPATYHRVIKGDGPLTVYIWMSLDK